MIDPQTACNSHPHISAAVGPKSLFDVAFEDVCFINDPAASGAELSDHELSAINCSIAADQLTATGVKSVKSARISDDSEEGDTEGDLKRFVTIVLQVEAVSAEEAEAMTPPSAFLEKIAEAVAGEYGIDIEGNWEVGDA